MEDLRNKEILIIDADTPDTDARYFVWSLIQKCVMVEDWEDIERIWIIGRVILDIWDLENLNMNLEI